MKNLSLFVLISFFGVSHAMQDDAASLKLTQEEESSYAWFSGLMRQQSFFHKLSQEDQDVINKQVKIQDDPEAVTRCRHNYADAAFDVAEKAGMKVEFKRETLKSALIKMTKAMHAKSITKPTNLLEARMCAWSALSEEEKATYVPENYPKNPEAAHQVSRKWSAMVAEMLVPIKLVEDTQEAKEKKAQELYEDQLAKFKTTYGVKKQ